MSTVFTKWAQQRSAHTFLKTTERPTPCLKEARSANWALWEGSVLSTNNFKTFHTNYRRKMKFRITNKANNYQKLSGLSCPRFFSLLCPVGLLVNWQQARDGTGPCSLHSFASNVKGMDQIDLPRPAFHLHTPKPPEF